VLVATPHLPRLEGGLIAVLRLEAGCARIPCKEALEGLMEMAEWLGVGARGDLAHEGDVGIDAGDEGLLQRHPVRLPASLVLAVPLRQAPMVGQAGAACGLEEERHLGRSRPQCNDMGEQRHEDFN
jgi:hypothetical protein